MCLKMCKNVLDIVICHLETDAYHSLNVCPVTDESSFFWFSDLLRVHDK